MDTFVLGFVQDLDGQRVLLIEKARPEFMKGKLNGIGGKLEAGETPVQAMVRECQEECDLFIPADEWIFLGHYGNNTSFLVHVFGSVANLNEARTKTDEIIRRVYWHEVDKLSRQPGLANGVDKILASLHPQAFQAE